MKFNINQPPLSEIQSVPSAVALVTGQLLHNYANFKGHRR